MSNDFTYSWQAVERGCWEYFNALFGTLEGYTAFSLRNLPKTLPDANSFIWRFVISGGSVPVQRQTRTENVNGAWLMDALFEAWTTSDDTAMWLGGLIFTNTPVVSTDVPGLARLYPTSFPVREPDSIRLGGDDNAGQEILCVRLTVNMQAAFGNTDRRT
jgi:hypothetical protein